MKLEAKTRLTAAKPTKADVKIALQNVWDTIEALLSQKFRVKLSVNTPNQLYGSIHTKNSSYLDDDDSKYITKTVGRSLQSKGFTLYGSDLHDTEFHKVAKGMDVKVILIPNYHFMALRILCVDKK